MGIAALAGAFNPSKAEDRLAVMTRRKGRDTEAEGIILDELFPDAKAGLAGLINNLFERLGRMSLLFQQANSPIRPEVFFGLSAACARGRFRGDDPGPFPGSAVSRWAARRAPRCP